MTDIDGRGTGHALARKGEPVSWIAAVIALAMTAAIVVSGLAADLLTGRVDGAGDEGAVTLVAAATYIVLATASEVRNGRIAFLAGFGGFLVAGGIIVGLSRLFSAPDLAGSWGAALLVGPAMVAAFVAVTRLGARDGDGDAA